MDLQGILSRRSQSERATTPKLARRFVKKCLLFLYLFLSFLSKTPPTSHPASRSCSSRLKSILISLFVRPTDHCLENLRQSTLCHADASSLTTFAWQPDKARPVFNASESRHSCVDWGRLMGSVRTRVVDEGEVLRLRNPFG